LGLLTELSVPVLRIFQFESSLETVSEDVSPFVFRFKNGRKEKNIAALSIKDGRKVFLTALSDAIAPGTESMRMLKHVKRHTAFRKFLLRIATSF
jgi:hypothetical protein